MGEIVDFDPAQGIESNKLEALLNRVVEIREIRYENKTAYGREYRSAAIITNEGEFLSAGKAILNQLAKIEPLIVQGKVVRVKVAKRKNYLVFEAP